MNERRGELTGRRALVTGAASGIGRAIAAALRAAGAQVLIADLDGPAAEKAARATPGSLWRQVDVSDRRACLELITAASADLGGVDILVNNAGLQHVAPIVEFEVERFDYLLRTMLIGPFILTKAVLPGMIERRWGRIVNVGSIHSLVGSPNKSAYTAAKHGLLGLTRATALEVGEFGVTCNLVAPAYVRTALVENQIADQARTLEIPEEDVIGRVMLGPSAVKRLIEPAEVAAMVLYLCSDIAASITGSVQLIDGGWTAR